jgi:amino acid adenylation domain-containing protein
VHECDALRLRIAIRPGGVRQYVAALSDWQLPLLDFSAQDDPGAAADSWMREDVARPIDFNHDLLFTYALLRLAPEHFLWYVRYHHICMDGVGGALIAKRAAQIYSELVEEGSASRKDFPSLFELGDEEENYRRSGLNRDREYWLAALAARPDTVTLSGKSALNSRTFIRHSGRLPAQLIASLAATGRACGASLAQVIEAATALYLHRLTGADELILGLPLTARVGRKMRSVPGMTSNILPLRVSFGEPVNFLDLLKQVMKRKAEMLRHQRYRSEELRRDLGLKPADPNIYGVLVNVMSFDYDLDFSGCKASTHNLSNGPVDELAIIIYDRQDGTDARIDFDANPAHYSREEIATHQQRFIALLRQLASPQLECPLSTFTLLQPEEQSQVFAEFNATAHAVTAATVPQLFEDQTARTPDLAAVLSGERSWSYAELNSASNRLARHLAAMRIGPESLVGICMPRSPEMLVALFAVLKAGAAYLPLDSEYPPARLAGMLQDAEPVCILTTQELSARLPEGAKALLLDAADVIAKVAREAGENLSDGERVTPLLPGHPAYVIYTSGSTGTPKGVVIEHRSATAFIQWAGSVFTAEAWSGVLASTSISFDLSVFELFATLSHGGTVLLANSAMELPQLQWRDRVRLINTVPSAARSLLDSASLPASVQTINLAGEALPNALVQDLYRCAHIQRVFNLYGPSEDTTYSTFGLCPRGAQSEPSIGSAIWNTRAYVLDHYLQVLPVGVIGELYLSGTGLARGYLKRPGFTAERFIANPFEAGGRMYRTGDLVRWRANGQLDFLGRADHQVKIRGFRIEPGEIEAVLTARAEIKQAVVLASERPGFGKQLVAYVVPASPGSLDAAVFQKSLAEQLPRHMLPSAIVALPLLPLTPNGKLDRRALPAPEWLSKSDALPRTPEEEILCQLFCEVLARERAGIHDSFFDLGGHSLMAMQLLSRIRAVLGFDLPARTLFDSPTVAQLAEQFSRLAKEQLPAGLHPRPERLPVSFSQERLWFIDQIEGGSTQYHIPEALRLRGRLDITGVRWAMNEMVQRHESLRTYFAQVDGEPVQCISPNLTLDVPLIDLRTLDSHRQQDELKKALHNEWEEPFDLTHGPLIRAKVFKLAEDDHVFLRTFHHIVADGWSEEIFNREFAAYYAAFKEGRSASLTALPLQYADYVLWQRSAEAEPSLSAGWEYWKKQLSDAPDPLELPRDRPRPMRQSFAGALHQATLRDEQVSALEALARNNGCTLYMALVAAFSILLRRYSGQSDVLIGTPVADRHDPRLEQLIGYFSSAIVLRVRIHPEESFSDLLKQVRTSALDAYRHQEVPFEQLARDVSPQRSLNQPPVFQVMFALQNAPASLHALPGLEVTPLLDDEPRIRLDLELYAWKRDGKLACYWIYDRDLFDRWRIEQMAGDFGRLLESLTAERSSAQPETPLRGLQTISPADRERMLNEWNQTAVEYPLSSCVHQLFENHAAKAPWATAAELDERILSYGELDAQANQLAHYLIKQGTGPNQRAAICMERGPELLVALLSVLKAGGAYVPLDPAYPQERIAYMLQDSGAGIVLTQSALLAHLPASDARVIAVNAEWDRIAQEPSTRPGTAVDPKDLAYIIYTSGSTGRPKGVAVEHRQVCNQLSWAGDALQLGPEDCVLQKASYSFDASILEIFLPLAYGARIAIAAQGGERDIDYLMQLAIEKSVSYVDLAPSLLDALLDHPKIQEWKSLRIISSGAETLKPELAELFHQKLGAELWNTYGPTETTVQSTYFRCEPHARAVPIGKPVANTSLHVLDDALEPTPIGVAGELYIGGTGVTRGYWNRPGLTAEKFIADPFASEAGKRLYRTGDLVRWMPNGSLEFLGRADHQVKIRGFRIELGEIESALAAHPGVADAIVMVQERGSVKQLAAYVVADKSSAGADAELGEILQADLRRSLPAYMVPSVVHTLACWPLTPSGKVDRRALSALRQEIQDQPLPRRGEEEVLSAVFGDVLGVERVGREDNFFELGGHSLLAGRLVSRIRAVLRKEVAIRTLFEAPTVAGLAERLRDERVSEGKDAAGKRLLLLAEQRERADKSERVPMSYAQQRLWFMYRMEGVSGTYNIPLAVRLKGELKREALEQALRDVVERHEALRTVYPEREEGGEAYQKVLGAEEARERLRLEVERVRDEAELEERLKTAAGEGMELEKELPLRARLYEVGEREHVLLLVLHHIAGDGWSLGPLARDVEQAYGARVEGRAPGWESLRVQYGDYTLWQREMLGSAEEAGSVMGRQLEYWKQTLAGMPEEVELPVDRKRSGEMSYAGGTVGLELDEGLHRGLLALGRRSGASLFMVLQAGLGALLNRLGAGEDIPIGTVVAGRNEEELEEQIGFFVNTVVLRTDVSGDPSFAELVERVRGRALEAYQNQELPFERLVEELQPARTQGRHPLFQVMLTLQNTPLANLHLRQLITAVEIPETNIAKFDLTFGFREVVNSKGEPQGIEGEILYRKDLFDENTVSSLATRYVRLLKEMVCVPETRVHCAEILDPDEKHLLLETFNATAEQVPDSTVTKMFEDQVKHSPEATAVVHGKDALTYFELNEGANRLAHCLIRRGVGPEKLVGIALERSPEMVRAIVAVWKAGGAYVPLDPEYPRARLEYMVRDAQPQVMVTTEKLRSQLPQSSGMEVICLDGKETQAELSRSATHDPGDEDRTQPLLPEHPAYVIYTSGSTGIPKGVVVSHLGIPSLTRSHVRRLFLTQRSRVLQFASLNFDASFWELLMALTVGATLVLLEDERGGVLLQDTLRRQKITHAILTPSVLATLDERQNSTLENLVVVGEQCPGELITRWSRGRRVINAYGPTEITVCATISAPLESSATPPIGLPNANTRVYVLDSNLQPMPVGVAGELYIASPGLARGYLNRAALTAERFIANPFAETPGARMYRTGDVVRWRNDGNLEFVGRADHQIKIRGFRIELGEIEAALRSLPEIVDGAVVVKDQEHRGREIVAFVAARNPSAIDPVALRSKLHESLPAYMLPAAIVILAELPLTPSGKVDRVSLSRRPIEERRADTLVQPQSEFQALIAGIWKDLLGRRSIGIYDNFFDLGGHSLLLAQVHARLQKALHVRLPMVKLFEHPTVAMLASYLEVDEVSAGAKRKAGGRNRTGVIDIAIIGMACRFPGAPSVSRFWENLKLGIGSISALSADALSSLPQEFVNDPRFVNATGRLENVEFFDAAFFGLNPAEATAADPQQRLMLECAWETLESAGYNPRGQNIGVFAGAGESLYRDLLRGDPGLLRSLGEMQLMIGTGKDHLAPRLSYLLDLRGPSVPVNTACSTSLVAVHLACQSLMNGECDMALAGGVSLASQTGYIFEESGILSPDGVCRAFDADAQGTVPGSGAALVLLKPLDQAIAAGDHIRAVIKGSAINNDGNLKVGYTAPSVEGQRRVIERALANAGVKAEQLSYIETHGTGTPLGDPIEIEALRQVFAGSGDGAAASEKLCAIGSVKTNIGHCDSAAGIAGLIKAVLCLEHQTLVPTLHFEKPNPQLDLEQSRFYVNTQTAPWERTPRLAGVSSFGIGGTNAHVILAEAPSQETSTPSRPWQVLTLSARTESALERQKADLVNALLENQDLPLADVAFTLNSGRRAFPLRQSFVCANTEEAIATLSNSKEKTVRANELQRPVVFLFPGQGKAYADLGADLYRSESRFRSEVDGCCDRLLPLIGADLRNFMFRDNGEMDSEIYRPLFWQPALFTVEYAMAQLWLSWGIAPAAMVGHSLGEYVAATLAGVLKLDDALKLVAERARGTEALEAGAMLAVPAGEDEIHPYIKDGISLAAVNGPELCILAGPTDQIEGLYQQIAALNPIRLDASHAFHSRLVEPLMDPLARAASSMKLGRPQIPYLSNVTGKWMSDEDALDPGYWARHVRSTVRFHQCLQEAVKKTNCVFLEVGPGKVLSELARRNYPESVALASASSEPDGRAFAQTVGRLWSEGVAMDWLKYYAGEHRRRVPLPTYPFERQRYWVNTSGQSDMPAPSDPLALKDSPENWLYTTNWQRTNPLPSPDFGGDAATHWLVFSEPEGIGSKIATLLRHSGQAVQEVRRGKAFQQDSAGPYMLNAVQPAEYQRLLQSLGDPLPQRIIYAWDFSGDSAIAAAPRLDSLIYLAQALASSEKFASMRVALITSGLHRVLDEELAPDSEAAALGMIHVLPKEVPAIQCQNIDLDFSELGDKSAQLILAELAAETNDTVVAYRRSHRWLPVVMQTPLAPVSRPLFKRGGIYVITHAMQEIGFTLAEYLVRQFDCKVVMLDRSFFPRPQEWDQWVQGQGEEDPISRHIARVRGIHDSLMILSVDLTQADRLKQIKEKILREAGAIYGVFHLDKALKTGLILGMDASPSAAIKNDLAELAALEHTFGDELIVILSSNLAESGGIGQLDQAARSSIVAHFAERRAAMGRPTVTLELGTRAWVEPSEKSPDSDSFLSQQLEEKRERFGMSPQECVAALQNALALSLPDVIVSTRDFNALMEQQHLFTTDFFQQQMGDSAAGNGAGPGKLHGRPEVSSAYVAPRNEVETLLLELWQGTFRIQEIGVDDNFFELGGHSLLAVQLLKNMNQTFSSRVTLKDLFDGPTIAQLAQKIAGSSASHDDSAELEALLAEIEGMSADELQAELDGNKKGMNTE